MKYLLLFWVLLIAFPVYTQNEPVYGMVIHGGAGVMSKDRMSQEQINAYRIALDSALEIGRAILKANGTALDAVEQTIRYMENVPLFNAGKGAVLNDLGYAELDASIMDGSNLNAGAVSGVKTLRHPISAARMVMDSSVHVFMSGEGADAFAQSMKLERVEADYFLTERRKDQWKKRKGTAPKKHGTVGVAALDLSGNLAAGTSTGGMMMKKYGRVGDSPVIGAGTYAENETCAVSCTGHGEYFIRYAVAYDMSALMKYKGFSINEAAHFIIQEKLKSAGGTGGLIGIDRQGNIVMEFNTSGMFRAYVKPDSQYIGIFKEE
jgi:beta-aspartyl-peptidase (threonine type)